MPGNGGGIPLNGVPGNPSHRGERLGARLKRLLPLAGLLLLAGALWLLRQELRGFRFSDVLAYLQALPSWRIAAALALTAASYVVLTGYDALALRYVRHSLPYRKSAVASFIAYATSIALGHAVLTGGAIRYRLYSAWGLSADAISRIIGFCGLAFWVGFVSLGGAIFALDPIPPPAGFPVAPRLLGVLFVSLFAAWLAVNVVRTRPLSIGRWTVELPGWRITLGQAAVASLDLLLAASVLWMLLPADTIPFGHLLSAFLLAVIAGVVSGVPAGLGVFDGILVTLLSPIVSAPVALGALVAYRGIYYLLPFLIASIALVATELSRHRAAFAGGVDAVGGIAATWLPRLVPQILAGTTFLAGAVLLVTGVLPAVGSRMAWLARIVPLEAIEVSHFVGSVVGAALLIVARGLWRRRDGAWWIATTLLALGALASLLRGVDYIEATVLGLALLVLLPCHRYFTRRSALLTGPRVPGWTAAVGLVLLGTLLVGLFAYENVAYTDELWWQFAFRADAPRFLRGMGGASAVVLLAGLARVLRSAPRATGEAPTAEALARARAVIARSGLTEANLALLGDKRFLFSSATPGGPDDGFIMFAPQGGSWIALGGPVGPDTTREDLVWDFRAAAEAAGARPVFYQASEDDLPLLLDLGLAPYKLGEEAAVPLAGFSLEGGARRGLRRTVKKLDDAGCEFEVIPRADIEPLIPELRRISDAWLGDKSSEKGFSLGVFDEAYLRNFSIAVVRAPVPSEPPGETLPIVAFANLWANDRLLTGVRAPEGSPAAETELSPDLMRFDRGRAPDSVMEYLFTKMMLWAAAEGYGAFSLGMAPLAGLEPEGDARALAPLWNRMGALLFRHGEDFYNFQGLRAYKEKFDPQWSARYLAVPPGRMGLAAALVDVTTLISGGISGLLSRK